VALEGRRERTAHGLRLELKLRGKGCFHGKGTIGGPRRAQNE